MKRIFLIVLLILISMTIAGQKAQAQSRGAYYPSPGTVPTSNITVNPVQNGWGIIGQACAGCSSFYYQITRTQQTYVGEDGIYYFYYYFFFFSNSFYTNGNPGATYLTNVTFSADGVIAVQTPYILLESGIEKFGAWIRTRNPNAQIRFNVAQMNVY